MGTRRWDKVGIVPICAKIFKPSASKTKGRSLANTDCTIGVASVVIPGPQAIALYLLNSISIGKSEIAPFAVSRQPIINASGK